MEDFYLKTKQPQSTKTKPNKQNQNLKTNKQNCVECFGTLLGRLAQVNNQGEREGRGFPAYGMRCEEGAGKEGKVAAGAPAVPGRPRTGGPRKDPVGRPSGRGWSRRERDLRPAQVGTTRGSRNRWRRGCGGTAPTRGGAGRAAAAWTPPRPPAAAEKPGHPAARPRSCPTPGCPAPRPRRKRLAGAAGPGMAARRAPP